MTEKPPPPPPPRSLDHVFALDSRRKLPCSKMSFDSFRLISVLGRGHFGKVSSINYAKFKNLVECKEKYKQDFYFIASAGYSVAV